MKIIDKNLKNGLLKLRVETLDDLWHLSQVIERADTVKGKTTRKIRIGSKDERSSEQTRKTLTLSVIVESVELTEHSLRVLGTIRDSTDDVSSGSHHTLSIETDSVISITKKEWPKFHLDRIEEAVSDTSDDTLLVVFDREQATLALLKTKGYEILSKLSGDVSKKYEGAKSSGNFYATIIKTIQDITKRQKISHVVLGSPSFWKEELFKELNDDALKKKIISATCSGADESSIEELLKRPELKKVLSSERAVKEAALVDELLTTISKDGNAAYGNEEVKIAADAGAVQSLLITTELIAESRASETFQQLQQTLKTVDKARGSVFIITSSNDAGKKLDGFGGIAAILRYKISG